MVKNPVMKLNSRIVRITSPMLLPMTYPIHIKNKAANTTDIILILQDAIFFIIALQMKLAIICITGTTRVIAPDFRAE